MADIEKVIKGLKCHAKVNCVECPYAGWTICNFGEMLLADTISLLKEQEPRILGWDEIRNYPVVYGEFRGVKDIYPLIITVDNWGRCLSWNPGINVNKEFILLVSDEEDQKNTRCWDKMPTEEQRQAVKWE